MRQVANQIRWYKRDPNAALEGMAILTLEERGGFNTVLDLIYSHDGKIVDDDRFIAGWLRVDVRVWRRIRSRLIDLKKLYEHAGSLRNERADREVDAALNRVASAAQAGLASAAKRQAQQKEINDLFATSVQRLSNLPTTTPTKRTPSFSHNSAREHKRSAEAGHQKRPSELSRNEIEQAFAQRRNNPRPTQRSKRDGAA